MRLFEITQHLKDKTNCRNLSPEQSARHPYQTLHYVVLAENLETAVSKIDDHYGKELFSANWEEPLYTTNRPCGRDPSEPVKTGVHITGMEVTDNTRSQYGVARIYGNAYVKGVGAVPLAPAGGSKTYSRP